MDRISKNMPVLVYRKNMIENLFSADQDKYFISWETGTIAADSGNASYHMASFDYAYNCVAVMEWLFQQSK